MTASGGNGLTFKYPAHVWVGLTLAPMILSAFFAYVVFTGYVDRDYVDAAWETVLFLGVLCILPSLVLTPVSVKMSGSGISAYWCAIRIQRLRWGDVRSIKKTTSMGNMYPPNEFIDVIGLKDEKYNIIPNIGGSIKLNELLVGYADFKEKLSSYAHENHIPISYVDERVAKSQKSRDERRRWMRSGVPVDQL